MIELLSAEKKEIEEKIKLTSEWIKTNCLSPLDHVSFGQRGNVQHFIV